MARKGLSPKQRLFAAQYLVDLHATNAAIRAGYSAASAAQKGSDLLRVPAVARAVREGMRRQVARIEVTADKVVRELAIVAFSDIRHYQVADDGSLKISKYADKGAARAVSSVKRRVTSRGRGD